LQNQPVSVGDGKYFPGFPGNILPGASCHPPIAASFLQNPVVAPAGADLRASSTQRPETGAAGSEIGLQMNRIMWHYENRGNCL
jgi:hypothetical protein